MDKADIQQAALYRFAEQGFHATTMKQLANDLGVTAAALYYHFKSKDELLTALIEEIIVTDLELISRIKREGGPGSLDRMIYAFIYGVCHGREEAIIVEREASHLQEQFLERAATFIRGVEREYAECVAEEYELSGMELALSVKAVLGLGSSVLQWFRADGQLSADEVARTYIDYARGLLARAELSAAAGQAKARTGSEPVSFGDIAATIDENVAARRANQSLSPAGLGRHVGLGRHGLEQAQA